MAAAPAASASPAWTMHRGASFPTKAPILAISLKPTFGSIFALADLRTSLLKGTYRPKPVKRTINDPARYDFRSSASSRRPPPKPASAGSIYDEATNRRSGTFLPEAIRTPIQIVALQQSAALVFWPGSRRARRGHRTPAFETGSPGQRTGALTTLDGLWRSDWRIGLRRFRLSSGWLPRP